MMGGNMATSYWCIYYDDGKTYSSEDGAWEDAPTDGVLYVLEKIGDKIIAHTGNDFYYLVEGAVVATSDADPEMRRLGFKFGRTTSPSRYEKIGQRVAEDAKALQRK
jgi:hypothetical protein